MMPLLSVLLFLAANDGSSDYRQANELFQTGRFVEAGQALDRALTANPNLVPALTLRGKLAMAFNRFDDAREAFTKAVKLEPDSAYTNFLLGFFFYVDNDFKQAIAPLQRALRLNPSDARAAFYLALTYEGLAQPDTAIESYERTLALEKAKPSAETLTAYGRLLFTLGRYSDARVRIDRALQIDPKSRDAHYERGRLLFEQGKFAEAAAEGERALTIPGPGTLDRQIHFLLARAYKKAGNDAKAAHHLAAFKASPATLRR
jgi:tetratricopeptide (TPR) repeat protein